jgi:DNA polymerase II large subunit
MGRPEKAKSREMKPSVHVLFPIGLVGGPRREISKAASKVKIQVEIARRRCPKCDDITYVTRCKKCDIETLIEKSCPRCGIIVKEDKCQLCKVKAVDYNKRFINISEAFKNACNTIGRNSSSKTIKGVRGLMSATKIPETLEKGILRAKHDISTFKDGTSRFDATNAPLTHFKPSEIDAPLVKLKKIGYEFDVIDENLVDSDQLCELKVQDIIIPEKSVDYLINITKFIDELLEKMYSIPPYYNIKEKNGLIGHLVIGFAPHTSAGVVGRIIGFTKASVCYAHPLWHNTKRRDCDGDEDSIMMVLDVLINFSKAYLPARIGGMMDAPLILISRVNPLDVDEAHNIDVASSYPLSFYKKTLENADPKNFVSVIDTISQRLGTSNQFQGYFFTHSTNDINEGNLESSYMKLGSMTNKLKGQMKLATKIRAVKAEEVAKRVLNTHFMRDIAGNLRAFTGQKTRCKKCNAKYRRIPLSGKCTKCNGEIVLTVYKGGIVKYLDVAEELIKNYNLNHYYKQRIELIRDEIDSLFITKYKQVNLGKYF